MRRITLIMVLVMVFSLAGMSSSVFARDDESSRETLKGLNGIRLTIETLFPEVRQAGLTESQIQRDVELKFRLAGIKVLSEEESYKEKGMPYIYINVCNLKHRPKGLFIYNIICELRQYVFLERDPSINPFGTTWSKGGMSIGDIKDIRDTIKDYVDSFINAYLSVNPKK